MLQMIQTTYGYAAVAYFILAILWGCWLNRPRPEPPRYHSDR